MLRLKCQFDTLVSLLTGMESKRSAAREGRLMLKEDFRLTPLQVRCEYNNLIHTMSIFKTYKVDCIRALYVLEEVAQDQTKAPHVVRVTWHGMARF